MTKAVVLLIKRAKAKKAKIDSKSKLKYKKYQKVTKLKRSNPK